MPTNSPTDLADFTENLKDTMDNVEGFLRNYRSIGRKTRQMVLAKKETNNQIRDLISRVKGAENVTFRFRVPHRNMPTIPFEAILRCDAKEKHDDEFQLEISPVYRVTGMVRAGSDMRTPLSETVGRESQEINCLIIDASTGGQPLYADGRSFPLLDPMPEGPEEAACIFDLFEQQRTDYLQTEPKRISFDDNARAHPVEFLDDVFKERRWDIVHFVGHSYFRQRNNGDASSAYVFLPADPLPFPVECQRRSKSTSLAGLKMHHLA